jgi:predicted GNAT superfamily acetyltransferase
VSVLRPITPGDHEQVLAWNESNVEMLAPLDEERLDELLGWADLGCVIRHEQADVGFVVTFASGTAYDSGNYRWFTERAASEGWGSFYYLDRIVIDPAVRRAGVATRAYDEIEGRARGLAGVMCLEVNLDPPNEPSLAFHRARGYQEAGRQVAGGHLVSLMVKAF